MKFARFCCKVKSLRINKFSIIGSKLFMNLLAEILESGQVCDLHESAHCRETQFMSVIHELYQMENRETVSIKTCWSSLIGSNRKIFQNSTCST